MHHFLYCNSFPTQTSGKLNEGSRVTVNYWFLGKSILSFLGGIAVGRVRMAEEYLPWVRPGYSCGCAAFFLLLSRAGLTIVCVVPFTWPPAVHPSYKTMLKAHSVEYKHQSRNQTVWEEMQTHVSCWRWRGRWACRRHLMSSFTPDHRRYKSAAEDFL